VLGSKIVTSPYGRRRWRSPRQIQLFVAL